MIVDARGGDVRMSQPFLHLGDVRLMIERIDCDRRTQRMNSIDLLIFESRECEQVM
jgi:hypothetical protein